jgi:peptidoglycan hydrolase-like protein with peptidoglycan-binding domain
MSRLLGPDTSNVNGRTLNATAAHAGGCDFAIFKASEGGRFVDKLFSSNVKHAQQAGLLVAGYHFLHHGHPAGQARHYLSCVQRAGVNPGDIGHAVDVEALDGDRATCTIKDVRGFVAELRRHLGADTPVGVYSYAYYWKHLMGNPTVPARCWVWTALYVQPPGFSSPASIVRKGGSDHAGATVGYWDPWGSRKHYDLRQFTAKAAVAGIRPCDVSVFEGDRGALAALFGVGAKPASKPATKPSQRDATGDIMAKLPVVKRGQRTKHVGDVQALVTRHGHRATVDGVFGPATERAVKAVQSDYNIAADGVVGPVTWHRLLHV